MTTTDERSPLAGSTARLHHLVAEHADTLRNYVEVRLDRGLRTKEAVSDVVQSAIRELLENPGTFTYQGEEAFRVFLHRVVDHKLANKRRHYGTLKRLTDREQVLSSVDQLAPLSNSVPTPSEAAISSEELERLRSAIDFLSEEDRRLLSMHKILEIPMSAVAREVNKPETTVRSRMARIMAELSFRMRVATEL